MAYSYSSGDVPYYHEKEPKVPARSKIDTKLAMAMRRQMNARLAKQLEAMRNWFNAPSRGDAPAMLPAS